MCELKTFPERYNRNQKTEAKKAQKERLVVVVLMTVSSGNAS